MVFLPVLGNIDFSKREVFKFFCLLLECLKNWRAIAFADQRNNYAVVLEKTAMKPIA